MVRGTSVGHGKRVAAVLAVSILLVQVFAPVVSAGSHEEKGKFNWGTVTGKIPTFGGAAVAGGVACVVATLGTCALVGAGVLAVNGAVNFGINAYSHRGTEQSCFQWGQAFACATDSESFHKHATEFAEDPNAGDAGWMAVEMAASSLPVTGKGWSLARAAFATGGDKAVAGATARLTGATSGGAAHWSQGFGTTWNVADDATKLAGGAKAPGAAADWAARRGSGILGQKVVVDPVTKIPAKQTNALGKLYEKTASAFTPKPMPKPVPKKFLPGKTPPVGATVRTGVGNTLRTTGPKGFLPVVSTLENPFVDLQSTDRPQCGGKTGDDWDKDGYLNEVENAAGTDPCDPNATPRTVAQHVNILIEPESGTKFLDTQRIDFSLTVRTTGPEDYLRAVGFAIDGVPYVEHYPKGRDETTFLKSLYADSCAFPPGKYWVVAEVLSAKSGAPVRQQHEFTVERPADSPCTTTPFTKGPIVDPSNPGAEDDDSSYERVRTLLNRSPTYNEPKVSFLPSLWWFVVVGALLVGSGFAWYRGYDWGRWAFMLTAGIAAIVLMFRAMENYPALGWVLLMVIVAVGIYVWRSRTVLEVD